MYGDGNSTRLVRDVMLSADQIIDGMRQSTGIDLRSILAGFVGGKAAQPLPASGLAEEEVSDETQE